MLARQKVSQTAFIKLEKKCPRCGKVKTRDEFGRTKKGYIGMFCLDCIKEGAFGEYNKKCQDRYNNYVYKKDGLDFGTRHIPYNTRIGNPDLIMDFITNHVLRNHWENVQANDREIFIRSMLFLSDLLLIEGREDYKRLMDELRAIPYKTKEPPIDLDVWD